MSGCLTDATSTAGLKALARERPGDWRDILLDRTPEVRWHPHVTVAEVLAAGRVGGLLPDSTTSPGVLAARRTIAHQLALRFGRTRIVDVDEQLLAKAAIWLLSRKRDSDAVPSAAQPPWTHAHGRRAATLLRLVGRSSQIALGLRPIVRLRSPQVPGRSPAAQPVHTARWPQVRRLLECSDERLAAVIVLVYGAGMTERQVLRLRVRDLRLPRKEVVVRPSGLRGPGAQAPTLRRPIPDWSLSALHRAFPELGLRDGMELLFPSTIDDMRPRATFTSSLVRANQNAGLQPAVDFAALLRGHPPLVQHPASTRASEPRSRANGASAPHPARPPRMSSPRSLVPSGFEPIDLLASLRSSPMTDSTCRAQGPPAAGNPSRGQGVGRLPSRRR